MDDQITLTAYADQVRELIRHERTDEAIAICKHILRFYPKYIDAYRQMGEAYLERGDHESAKDLFRRVLSADPENRVAYIGLAIIFEQEYVPHEAVWHMERAYELMPGDSEVQQELVRLYNTVEMKAHLRAKLTPGALARIYAQEGLFSQAVQEFRAIIATTPARFDIQVALAETLWRMGRLSEATQVAQSILEQLPYCLKANLILGAAWKEAGLPDSDVYLQRAQTLDPTNRIATQVLGSHSPLPLLEPTVPRYVETPVEAVPATFEPAPSEPTVSTEPGWLESLETPTAEPITEMPSVAEQPAEPVTETQLPSWLRTEKAAPIEEETPPVSAETPVPSWLETPAEPAEAAPIEPIAPTEQIPDWLKGSAPAGPAEPIAPIAEPTEPTLPAEQIPDWLKGFAPAETVEPTPKVPTIEERPAWLQELPPIESAATPEQPIVEQAQDIEVTSAEELATLLQEPGEPTIPAEQAPARATPPEEELPPWLQGFEELGYKRPSEPAFGEEQPAAGEPTPTEAETPAWLTRLETPPAAETPAEEYVELPAWMREPTAPAQPTVEEPFLTESAEQARLTAPAEAIAPEPAPPAPPKRKRQPRGYGHLVQARAYRDANRLDEALAEYDYVVQHAPRLVNQVIDDLEILIQRLDVPLDAHRILGDAYTRADRLAEALERYRFVLEHVS